MSANVVADSLQSVFSQTLAQANSLSFVTSSRQYVELFFETAIESDSLRPEIRLLTKRQVLEDIFDDFVVASQTADLVEWNTLSVRALERPIANSLIVTDNDVIAIVAADRRSAGLVGTEQPFVDAAADRYETYWQAADHMTVPAPPLSTVTQQLTDRLGPETTTDFKTLLSVFGDEYADSAVLDEVIVGLLAAAANDELLYDVSHWGEEVGIASKATFSRTKTTLEDAELIRTEKVPIDVGRPRLRLTLPEEQSAVPEQLLAAAYDRLSD